MASNVYGIDLGTTHSCIAYMDDYERPDVIHTLDGQLTMPSVVMFETSSSVVVGATAKEEAILSADRVVTLVKRRMGDPEWRFTDSENKSWSAPQISAIILRELAHNAERAVGAPVKDVVITVPAYFGEEERRATMVAGTMAGLRVKSIINEPTAAALAYGLGRQGAAAPTSGANEESVLVYDLGGGTFDATVISIANQQIKVIATAGHHFLGGADIDESFADYLTARLRSETGLELDLESAEVHQMMIQKAEDAKRKLTARDLVDVAVNEGGRGYRVAVKRTELEDVAEVVVKQTISLTQDVLKMATEKGIRSVSRVLLVGGSSKMPLVARRLNEELALPMEMSNPDLAVCHGAAYFARKLELDGEVEKRLREIGSLGHDETLEAANQGALNVVARRVAEESGLASDAVRAMIATKIQNVLSHGFGVFVWDRQKEEYYTTFLAHRNDPLPLSVEKELFTVLDDQAEVEFRVCEQGGNTESRELADNTVIAESTIRDIPDGYKAGTPLRVRLTMSSAGLLELTAEHAAGQSMTLQVETGRAVSAEDVERGRRQVAATTARD